jgi:hypothetical protein
MAPPSLTSALDEGEWSASRPGRFTPGEKVHSTHCIGGWVGLKRLSGRCGIEKNLLLLPGIEPQPVAIPNEQSRLLIR